MRARTVGLVGSFLTLALTCAFVIGCGGDDDKAPTSQLGDLSDPQFVVVNETIEALVDSSVSLFGSGFASLTSISAGDEIDPAQQIVVPDDGTKDNSGASYTNGWHYVWASISGANYQVVIHDSVQFRNAAGAVQQNPAGLASLTYRRDWSFMANDTTVSHANLDAWCDFDYSGLNTDQATINGDQAFTMERKTVGQTNTWHDLEVAATYTNMSISKTPFGGWAQSCPESGTVTGSVEYVRTVGANAPDTTTWTYSLLFTDGVVDVQVVSGGTTWQTTYNTCTVGSGQ